MRSYSVPMGRMADYAHPHPERTATRAQRIGWDIECKVWTSRAAMLEAVRMSDTGKLGARPFRPLTRIGCKHVPLHSDLVCADCAPVPTESEAK